MRYKIFVTITVMILAACNSTPQLTPILEPSVSPAISLSYPTKTSTVRPYFTPTPAETATYMASPQPTSTPTLTPLPTLSVTEAAGMVKKVLTANAFCRLPCIGNITPGKTTWSEATSFLVPFAKQVFSTEYRVWAIEFMPPKNAMERDKLFIWLFRSSVERVDAMVAVWLDYSVQQLFADYGRPAEIYFYVTDYPPEETENKFELFFYYSEQGFSARYSGNTGKGEKLKICPAKAVNPSPVLLTWPITQSTSTSFQKIYVTYKLISYLDIQRYRPISEYGGMTLDEFYEIYKDPANQQQCYEIENPWLSDK